MSDRHWFEVRRWGRLRYVAPVAWEGVLALLTGGGLVLLDIVALTGATRLAVGAVIIAGGVMLYLAKRQRND